MDPWLVFRSVAWTIGGFVVLALLAVIACVAILRSRQGGRRVNYKTGIEIWEGKPGSGKSYGVVDLLLRVIVGLRRPVYTNLPLRFRTVRRYLQNEGGHVLAKYIRPLRMDHFMRFLDRNQLLSDFREEHHADGWGDSKIEAEFIKLHGPHVIWGKNAEGVEANWFPPGAVFCMDELHRWFDQRNQKDEPPQLLTYLTMHRHHLHWIIVMSQDRMQISLPWRRNAVRFVRCVDKSKLPFLFGLKFPLPAFFYEEEPAELLGPDGRRPPNFKATETWMRIPMFNGGLIWRMYDSFTHMGSVRRLEMKIAAVRSEIEGVQHEKAEADMRRSRMGWLWPVLACGAVGFLVWEKIFPDAESSAKASTVPAGAVTSATIPVIQRRAAERASVAGKPTTQPAAAPVPGVPPPPFFPGRISAMGDTYCVVDGVVVGVGQTFRGVTLLAVNYETGQSVWSDSVDTMRVSLGGGLPERLSRRIENVPNLGPAAPISGPPIDEADRRSVDERGPDGGRSPGSATRPTQRQAGLFGD